MVNSAARSAFRLMVSSSSDKVWTAWILSTIGSFAVLEGYALKHNEDTLSRWTWKGARAWPPLGVVYGIVFGGLAVHFFWTGGGLDNPKSQ